LQSAIEYIADCDILQQKSESFRDDIHRQDFPESGMTARPAIPAGV
jgi:hypothetical protein